MRRVSLRKAIAIVIPLVLVAVIVVPWVVDGRVHSDKVPRNVELDGRAIGGFGEADLEARVHNLAGYYPDTPVEIRSGDRTLETTVGRLGGEVDQEATVDAALAIEQGPVAWAQRLLEDEVAPVVLTMRTNPAIAALQEIEGSARSSPIEPLIQHSGFGFAVVPGEAGHGIPAAEVIDEVIAGAAAGEEPIVVDADSAEIPPRFTDEEAEALAEEANTLTENGITITAGGESAEVARRDPRGLGHLPGRREPAAPGAGPGAGGRGPALPPAQRRRDAPGGHVQRRRRPADRRRRAGRAPGAARRDRPDGSSGPCKRAARRWPSN